ncbi:MAG: SpoIIE family protein phosphatase [Planctomycetales bacterium]
MPFLEVRQGGFPQQTVELQGDRIVIGRNPACDLILDDESVSRRHAQILHSHGTYYLEDLRSRNGTLLNGGRVQERTRLQDKDTIHLCNFELQFLEQAQVALTATGTLSHRSGTTHPLPHARKADTTPRTGIIAEHAPLNDDSIISSVDLTGVENPRTAVKPELKLQAMVAIVQSLRKKLAFDELLPGILDHLLRIFPQAKRGLILLPNSDEVPIRFHIAASLSRSPESEGHKDSVSYSILRAVLEKKQAILSEDVEHDSRFGPSDSLAELSIRSMMCVPLLGQDDNVIGILQLESPDLLARFQKEDLELLAGIACVVALSIENAMLLEDVLRRRDLEKELEFATQVQLGFLPSKRPQHPGYEFFDYYEPAHQIGGDFFDYIPLDDGRWGIVIGDVAGKGIPAALLMARMLAQVRAHVVPGRSAGDALSSLNAAVSCSGLGHGFVTTLVMIVDPVRNELEWSNAGHLLPMLRDEEGQILELLTPSASFPLGVKPDTRYQNCKRTFNRGDCLLLFTDGVTEAMSPRKELYGTQRIRKLFAKYGGSVQQLGHRLLSDVEEFYDGIPQHDDMCVIAMRRQIQQETVDQKS